MIVVEVFKALASGVIGMVVGAMLTANDADRICNNNTTKHFGYTVSQGEQFKEQCEANLPRNVHCSTVVLYVPDNESEQ